MKTRTFLLMFLVLCGVVARADEQAQPSPAPVPAAPAPLTGDGMQLFDMPSAKVQVSWSDIIALIDNVRASTREEETRREPPKPERPPAPVPWTISAVEYEAEALSSASVRLVGRYAIHVWEEREWVKVPIIGHNAAPDTATLDGAEVALLSQEGMLHLVLHEPGTHALELTFYVSCTSKEGVVSFAFPTTEAAVSHMALRIPVRDANVRSAMAANVAIERGEDGLTANLAFRSTDTIEVSWTLPALLAKPKPEARPEPPRVTCTTSTLASVSDHYVACESLLQFDVLRGKADSFRLCLPPGVNILNIEGQGAAWSQSGSVAANGPQEVEAKVNHEIADHYDLTVRYEAAVDEKAATITVPALVAKDVVRQTGFTGVTARGSVEVNPGPGLTGLTRIDTSELPIGVRKMSPSPILFAYKYTAPEYLLAIDLHRLEDVPVRVAGIDRAELTTVITEDGMAVTRAVYFVRNNIKQFLRVEVEPDAEVWGAEVNGKPVKPARDSASEAILIPLLKSVENSRQLGAFPVQLTYMRNIEKPGGFLGALGLRAPAADILANEVLWQVLLPEGRRVYRAQGDLDPFDGKVPVGQRFVPGQKTAGTGRVNNEKLMALREGIARFYIQDINNPAAAATAAGDARYVEGEGAKAAPELSDVAIAGVLPVGIDLPVEGTAHRFRQVLVAQGRPLALEIHFYNRRVGRALRGLMACVLMAVSFVVSLRFVRASRAQGRPAPAGQGSRRKYRMAALGVLAAAGVLAVKMSAPVAAPILLGVALGAAAAFWRPGPAIPVESPRLNEDSAS